MIELNHGDRDVIPVAGEPGVCVCYVCHRAGWELDEFTSPYTGRCAECERAAKENHKMLRRQPKHGDTRVRERFLWFPKKLGGVLRWLERARYGEVWVEDIRGGGWQSYCWLNADNGIIPAADGYFYDIHTWTIGFNPSRVNPSFRQ